MTERKNDTHYLDGFSFVLFWRTHRSNPGKDAAIDAAADHGLHPPSRFQVKRRKRKRQRSLQCFTGLCGRSTRLTT